MFLCTEYEGEPDCVDLEMTGATFRTMEELDQLAASMFQPFADGLEILKECIYTPLFFGNDEGEMYGKLVNSVGKAVNGDGLPVAEDGGPGSGNFGHEGRPGQLGGSSMGTGGGVDTIMEVAAKIPKPQIEAPEDKPEKIAKPFLEKIGYGGKPTVLSSDDFAAVGSDYPVQYRGIDSPDAFDKITGEEFFIGRGANGVGANTTPDRGTAEEFAGEGGGVVEIKLDKSAKVISDKELMEKMRDFRGAKPPDGIDGVVFRYLTSDPGCIAASLGYDAISDSATGWLNIVNRGKMIVKKQGD